VTLADQIAESTDFAEHAVVSDKVEKREFLGEKVRPAEVQSLPGQSLQVQSLQVQSLLSSKFAISQNAPQNASENAPQSMVRALNALHICIA